MKGDWWEWQPTNQRIPLFLGIGFFCLTCFSPCIYFPFDGHEFSIRRLWGWGVCGNTFGTQGQPETRFMLNKKQDTENTVYEVKALGTRKNHHFCGHWFLKFHFGGCGSVGRIFKHTYGVDPKFKIKKREKWKMILCIFFFPLKGDALDEREEFYRNVCVCFLAMHKWFISIWSHTK